MSFQHDLTINQASHIFICLLSIKSSDFIWRVNMTWLMSRHVKRIQLSKQKYQQANLKLFIYNGSVNAWHSLKAILMNEFKKIFFFIFYFTSIHHLIYIYIILNCQNKILFTCSHQLHRSFFSYLLSPRSQR